MSEEKITLIDLLLDYDLNFDELKYGLRTKVDKDTHDELEEWSNHLTNGNLSGIMRICLVLGLQKLKEDRAEMAPTLSDIVGKRRKWLGKQTATARLQRAAMELEQRYDPDYAAAAKKYAEAEGIQWPMQGYPTQVDPLLKRITDRLKSVLQEQEIASLRDVYKGMSNIDADTARVAILKLEEMGAVRIAGSREDYGRMEISWAEIRKSD